MHLSDQRLRVWAFGLLAATSVAAGCSNEGSPFSEGNAIKANSSLIRPGAAVTTSYKVVKDVYWPITGSYNGPRPCWTVSPSPLPNDLSKKVTVSYVTGCSTKSVTFTYEFAPSNPWPCTYKLTYDAGFVWTATPYYTLDCSVATAPPGSDYDEQLIYGPNESPKHGLHIRLP